MNHEVVRSTGDAHLGSYTRAFDGLELHLTMWDESELLIKASGVHLLRDSGTWEVDAIVRVPALDEGDRHGFGLVDTEGTVTMQFSALTIDVGN